MDSQVNWRGWLASVCRRMERTGLDVLVSQIPVLTSEFVCQCGSGGRL